ncbi:MAG: glycosyltransferase [Pirellulales bacterium]|nr:glycosyltransferase [Pirellulales bacterium]
MGLLLLIALSFLAVLALLHTFLMGVQTWEHRRFARSRLLNVDRCRPTGRAMVFIPCKGIDVGLEENLSRFFHQDYDNYEITFIVESPWDPACKPIAQAMADHPHRVSHLVVAGRATHCGQKVHNLRTAIQRKVSSDIEFLVFADSDARPGSTWLRAIVGRLGSRAKKIGAVTGYRWLMPTRPSLANHLLYSINSTVATLLGSRRKYPIWGGSWAIRRSTFDEIGLLDAWRGTLSDDLVATTVLRRHGLAVRYEPACMVASPMEGTLREHFQFLRRQYIISRFYVPSLWAGGLVGSLVFNVGWLSILAMLVWAAAAGSWLVLPSLGVALAFYGLNVVRASIRQDLVSLYVPDCQDQLRRASRFDIWLNPLAGFFNAWVMVASGVGRHIRWRNVTYRLQVGGITTIVARSSAGARPPDEARTTPIQPIHWPRLSDENPSDCVERNAA